jgi:hypothetical protein
MVVHRSTEIISPGNLGCYMSPPGPCGADLRPPFSIRGCIFNSWTYLAWSCLICNSRRSYSSTSKPEQTLRENNQPEFQTTLHLILTRPLSSIWAEHWSRPDRDNRVASSGGDLRPHLAGGEGRAWAGPRDGLPSPCLFPERSWNPKSNFGVVRANRKGEVKIVETLW